MAGLKCSYCGGSIRYHDMPNGIEHTVFSMKNWEKLVSTVYDPNNERMHEEWNTPGPYLYRSDTIWEDFEDDYFEVWVCPHCGTIAVFDNRRLYVRAVYTPINDDVEVDWNADKYVVFSDYVWEEIAESSIPVSEIPNKFKASYYVIANSDYVWLFNSNFESDCTKAYKRIAIASK
ncbi:MAG: hypothetical protein VZR27_11680 [Acutalibacteraceae bacterium]|nr:hypothetical protein [Acutalibacteraceae bacterium]